MGNNSLNTNGTSSRRLVISLSDLQINHLKLSSEKITDGNISSYIRKLIEVDMNGNHLKLELSELKNQLFEKETDTKILKHEIDKIKQLNKSTEKSNKEWEIEINKGIDRLFNALKRKNGRLNKISQPIDFFINSINTAYPDKNKILTTEIVVETLKNKANKVGLNCR